MNILQCGVGMQRDDKIDLRIEFGKMWTFQFGTQFVKEEKVHNLAKLSGVAKEEKKSQQFGKTKWSRRKHEKWTWQNRQIIAVWTSEFGKKWSWQKWKTELGQIPDQAFGCTANTPHQGTIHWMIPVCYDSVVDEP